jgi:ATP-dependent protease ClpP protease subunit
MNIPRDAPLIYISFSSEINQVSAESLISTLANCANAGVKTVHILLSTTGGRVINGFNLYNMLKGMPFEVITHNVGQVDSSGILVFLAGEKRYATANSTFTFHGVGFTIEKERLEEKDLRDKLANVLNQQERMAAEFIQRANITAEEAAEFFGTEQTINADTALNKGIIHEIRDVHLTPGCPVISHVFQRQ